MVITSFFPIIGYSTRRSTRLYVPGNTIEFMDGKTYKSDLRNDSNMGTSLDVFHSEAKPEFGGDEHLYSTQKKVGYYDGKYKGKTPLDWLERKFKKMKTVFFKPIYGLKGVDIVKEK